MIHETVTTRLAGGRDAAVTPIRLCAHEIAEGDTIAVRSYRGTLALEVKRRTPSMIVDSAGNRWSTRTMRLRGEADAPFGARLLGRVESLSEHRTIHARSLRVGMTVRPEAADSTILALGGGAVSEHGDSLRGDNRGDVLVVMSVDGVTRFGTYAPTDLFVVLD